VHRLLLLLRRRRLPRGLLLLLLLEALQDRQQRLVRRHLDGIVSHVEARQAWAGERGMGHVDTRTGAGGGQVAGAERT
jgi:hypothetical protein